MSLGKLIVYGMSLKFALCPHGCKIYPVASLAMHIAAHAKLAAGIATPRGWNENRPGKHHVANTHGRPKKKASDKVQTVNIPRDGKGRYK